MGAKKRLSAKYIFRRIFLVTLAAAVLGGGGWFAYHKITAVPASVTPQNPESPSRVFDAEPESAPNPVPDAEPEPFSVPEPQEIAKETDNWELLLVNSKHPLPEDYAPELEAVTESYKVDKRISGNVKRMFAKAKEDGISLIICSAHRTVELQESNFERKKQELMAGGRTEEDAIAVTASIIAVPGTSEHHTGLAMDIVTPSYQLLDEGFENTPAFKWLDANAYKYGFILRYPKDKSDITKIIYEPWHYRYVGEENAAKIKASGLCLEEYVELVKNGKDIPLEAATSALEGTKPISVSGSGSEDESEDAGAVETE